MALVCASAQQSWSRRHWTFDSSPSRNSPRTTRWIPRKMFLLFSRPAYEFRLGHRVKGFGLQNKGCAIDYGSASIGFTAKHDDW